MLAPGHGDSPVHPTGTITHNPEKSRKVTKKKKEATLTIRLGILQVIQATHYTPRRAARLPILKQMQLLIPIGAREARVHEVVRIL